MTNFKKITIILIITVLMALCLANTVMAKEYTGGKWKYDKYNEDIYKDFYIKKGKTQYNVHVSEDYYKDKYWVGISNIPKGSRDVSHGHKNEIIKKNGKIYVGTKYKYDYKKQDFVVYNYKLVKKIIKKPINLKIKVKMTDFKYSLKTKYKTYHVKTKPKFYTNYYYHPKTKTLHYTIGTGVYLPKYCRFESIIV
ncbi:hypothetical protein [Methanobrevibacter arboriphilus]|nr:hypothetical protein [Methanobrevibacter arboriphilus]